VILERSDLTPAPRPHERVGSVERVPLKIFDRFAADLSVRAPVAYFVPEALADVIDLLRMHGIVVEQLVEPWQGALESFRIAEVHVAERPYQGVRMARLEGQYGEATVAAGMPAGSYLVRTAQPLGVLALHLLEAQSLDGVIAWRLIPDAAAGGTSPIQRTHERVLAVTRRVSAAP
jgi:hypothetical protein